MAVKSFVSQQDGALIDIFYNSFNMSKAIGLKNQCFHKEKCHKGEGRIRNGPQKCHVLFEWPFHQKSEGQSTVLCKIWVTLYEPWLGMVIIGPTSRYSIIKSKKIPWNLRRFVFQRILAWKLSFTYYCNLTFLF